MVETIIADEFGAQKQVMIPSNDEISNPRSEYYQKQIMGFVFQERDGIDQVWSATGSWGHKTALVETFNTEKKMRDYLRTK